MKTDTVIELKDGKKYLLLLESEIEVEDYFLAVVLDQKEEPTQNYAILQKITKEGKEFVKRIDDPIILNNLLEDYKIQYDDLYTKE